MYSSLLNVLSCVKGLFGFVLVPVTLSNGGKEVELLLLLLCSDLFCLHEKDIIIPTIIAQNIIGILIYSDNNVMPILVVCPCTLHFTFL